MSIAKKMWDYLKSIGFVDIPNDDERLGCQTRGNWKYIISRDNLCAYCSRMDKFIGFVDNLKGNDGTNTDLNIHTVQDLENWLRKEYPEFYKEETNMITKDNIEAVLKHNGIKPISQCAPNENKKGYIKSESRLHLYGLDICLDNPNLISIIEAHIGKKLEPLPEEEIVLKVGDGMEKGSGKIKIYFKSGLLLEMQHYQECCEDVCGDENNLIGYPLLVCEENVKSSDHDCGSETWTFYKFATQKGYVDIRWLGESNGYYSESVDWIIKQS